MSLIKKTFSDSAYAKHISFALALIAQRFPDSGLAPAYCLMSYLIGKENLVGLERFLIGISRPEQKVKMIAFLGREVPFDSFQENSLLKNIGFGDMRGGGRSFDSLPVRGWVEDRAS